MCGVAQQTVSAWVKGKSAPGYFARRSLLALEKKTPSFALASPADSAQVMDVENPVLRELNQIVQGLPPELLLEVLHFAQFKDALTKECIAKKASTAYPTTRIASKKPAR